MGNSDYVNMEMYLELKIGFSVNECLTKNGAFEPRMERDEEVSHACIWIMCVHSRGYIKCKGPEVEAYLVHSRNNKVASVAEKEGARVGEDKTEKGTEEIHV